MTTKRGYAAAVETLDDLSTAVRRKRNEEGLSLRAAAEEAGVTWTVLRTVEEGLNTPRVDTVRALLVWLGS